MTDSTQTEVAYQKAAQKAREAKEELEAADADNFRYWLATILLVLVEEVLTGADNQGRRTEDDDSPS